MTAADRFDPVVAARALLDARRSGRPLQTFPGAPPDTLEHAYACQRAGVSLRGQSVTGWKVARLTPQWSERLGAERLVGPVFAGTIYTVDRDAGHRFEAADAHYAAVEAENVLRLGRDAPPSANLDAERVSDLIDAAFLGAELASSPLGDPDGLGPLAVIADCGINAGLLLGDPIRSWRTGLLGTRCETQVGETLVGSAVVDVGRIDAALRHALFAAELAGLPLRRGQFVSTGALTGVHPLRAGETASIRYGSRSPIIVTRPASPETAITHAWSGHPKRRLRDRSGPVRPT